MYLPDQAYAAFVRSPHAHAHVRAIDFAPALAAADVVAVLTGEDYAADGLGILPCGDRCTCRDGSPMQVPPHPALPMDRVRFVGEAVAMVIASSELAAREAADLVQVEYEPLDAVIDAQEAIQPGASTLHDPVPDNISARFVVEIGDVDRAMAEADEVFEEDFYIQRHAAVPLETRGLLAEFDEGQGILSVWGPTKVIHTNREILAEMLDMPESCIRFIEPEVGGGVWRSRRVLS